MHIQYGLTPGEGEGEGDSAMVRRRVRGQNENNEQGAEMRGEGGEYEDCRAQRIKENMERMKSLGILGLSKQLKLRSSKPKPPSSSLRKTKPVSFSSNDPPRRSSRLKDRPAVSYSEKRSPKKETSVKSVIIHIPEGKNPEIYTEEHEKLLGECEAVWELYVDGYDEDGQREYDPVEGKSCHQCRQKTLGQHTRCSKCVMVAGQLCGDCLYTRYGENITEVNVNPDWVCPVCRGICNCSRCRRDKGWEPTGSIYNKVVKLGFKSVAHYLIHTRRGQEMMEVAIADSPISADGSLSIDQNVGSSNLVPQFGAEKNVSTEDNPKLDSDEEYRGDGRDGDGDDDDNNSGFDDDDSQ